VEATEISVVAAKATPAVAAKAAGVKAAATSAPAKSDPGWHANQKGEKAKSMKRSIHEMFSFPRRLFPRPG
jgi:hypothetical protein